MGSCTDGDSPASLVLLTEGGGFQHSAGMPDKVSAEFAGKHKTNQDYVALGTEGRYYIKRKTGYTQWSSELGDEFSEYVKSEDNIKKVTFGCQNDSWFVLLDRGGYQYQGAPSGFKEAHNSKKYAKKTIANVSWGPNGEWWARWTDGSWKANGLSDECNKKMDELKRDDWDVKEVVFGPNREWIIRYDRE